MDDIEVAYAESTWDTNNFPHALADIVGFGYKGVFARGELLESYIDRQDIFTEIISGNNISVAGSEGTINIYDVDSLEESLQHLDLRLNFLQRCKANTIILKDESGSFTRPTLEDRLKLYSFLDEVGGIARKKGIKLCFLPHEDSLVSNKNLVIELLENTRAEDMFLAFDPSVLSLIGIRPQTFLPLVVDRVGVFVLSDLKIGRLKKDPTITKIIPCPIGKGLINLLDITKTMECLDYSGWVIVKQPRVDGVNPKLLLKSNTSYVENELELII